LLKELRSKKAPVLVCSAGDFYGTADVFSEAKSHFVAHMMGVMGYDAIGVGEMDLNFGLSALVKDARTWHLPIVCANIVAKDDSLRVRFGGPASKSADRLGTAFPPYVIVTKGGTRFGFLGLLSPSTKVVPTPAGAPKASATPAPVEALTYTIGDPVQAAQAVIPDLRKSCDVLVVVAHMSDDEGAALARAVPGIDLMVLGHGGHALGIPTMVGETRLLRAVTQGQYVGELDMSIDGKHHLTDVNNRLHALVASYADDPDMSKRLDEFDKEDQKRQKELYAKQQLAAANSDTPGNRYLGVGTCQSCHPDAFDTYMKSGHAHAYQTLAEQFNNHDTNCVGCHVTGYGDVGGFSGLRQRGSVVDLADVQCEACHGPGSEHSRDGSYRARAVKSCVTCHTHDNDPDFDYDTYWPKIAH
jgi:Cytochrome c554 and c-prime